MLCGTHCSGATGVMLISAAQQESSKVSILELCRGGSGAERSLHSISNSTGDGSQCNPAGMLGFEVEEGSAEEELALRW